MRRREKIYANKKRKKNRRFCDGAGERMMQAARKVNRPDLSSASLRQRFPQRPRCQEPAGVASCAVGGATSASSDPRRLLAFTPALTAHTCSRAGVSVASLAEWFVGKIDSPFIKSKKAWRFEWAAKTELIKNELRVDWMVSQRKKERKKQHARQVAK